MISTVSKNSSLGSSRRVAWLVIVLALIYASMTVAVHRTLLADREAAVWDFYQLWYSARVLILDHNDPYEPQVAMGIQQALYGRTAAASESQAAFYYPLPLLLLVAPFALLSYSWAAAAWLSLLLVAVTAAVLVATHGLRWRLPIPCTAALIIAVVVWFPVMWSILLGQVAALLLLPLVISLMSLTRGMYRLAGVCLALAALKPQLVYALLPAVLLWSVVNARWELLISMVLSGVGLAVAAGVFLPTWPFDFLKAVNRYADVSPFSAPLQILLQDKLGLGIDWLWIVVGVMLGLGCLWLWKSAGTDPHRISCAAAMTLVVSTLSLPHIGMINQLVLLWPLVLALKEVWTFAHRGPILALAFLLAVVAVPWVVVAMLDVRAPIPRYVVEHQALSFFLPLLIGGVLGWQLLATLNRHSFKLSL